jgi:hypothetical protein
MDPDWSHKPMSENFFDVLARGWICGFTLELFASPQAWVGIGRQMGRAVVDLLASLLNFKEGLPSAASFKWATALVSHVLPCRLLFENLAVQLVKDAGVADSSISLANTKK